MLLLLALLLSVFDLMHATAFVRLPKIRGPCSVVLQEMHLSGYMVRDCTYLDPFVYWRIEYRMSFEGARSACQQIPGGDLVSIHTFDEKQVVSTMSENNYFNPHQLQNVRADSSHIQGIDQGVWIGLQDTQKTGRSWAWVDGSELDYKDWLSTRPVSRLARSEAVRLHDQLHLQQIGGSCAQFIRLIGAQGTTAAGWNDVSCRVGMKAICKAPRVAIYP